MGLRFFADHCIPNSIVKELLDAGHEIFRLRDHIPIESPDPMVIATAQELDSILISLNGDFSDKPKYPPANYKGIVALQVRNHPEIIPQLLIKFKDYLSSHPERATIRESLFLWK